MKLNSEISHSKYDIVSAQSNQNKPLREKSKLTDQDRVLLRYIPSSREQQRIPCSNRDPCIKVFQIRDLRRKWLLMGSRKRRKVGEFPSTLTVEAQVKF